ncbi:hypothetical protein EVB91_134 [Rhizobium phage RHph_I1_18]|nr:hypothetical protein EVB91_134 [Rhizobium phage RHph_I1_18]
MADWKGTRATIVVDNFKKHIEPYEFDVFLDTDTMDDVFTDYPLKEGWQIVINLKDSE